MMRVVHIIARDGLDVGAFDTSPVVSAAGRSVPDGVHNELGYVFDYGAPRDLYVSAEAFRQFAAACRYGKDEIR